MSKLFDMGGYEFYVWGSVGLALVVFAWNLLAPAVQHRALLERLADSDDSEPDAEGSGARS